MLSAGSLSVVEVAYCNPVLSFLFEFPGDLCKFLSWFTSKRINPLARFFSECINGSEKHVVAKIVQVTSEPKPGTSG